MFSNTNINYSSAYVLCTIALEKWGGHTDQSFPSFPRKFLNMWITIPGLNNTVYEIYLIVSLFCAVFSRSVVSDSLQPHGV